MLNFVKKMFRILLVVSLWINVIGCPIYGGMVGFGFKQKFLSVIIGVLVGVLTSVLVGGIIATVLAIEENTAWIEKSNARILFILKEMAKKGGNIDGFDDSHANEYGRIDYREMAEDGGNIDKFDDIRADEYGRIDYRSWWDADGVKHESWVDADGNKHET